MIWIWLGNCLSSKDLGGLYFRVLREVAHVSNWAHLVLGV